MSGVQPVGDVWFLVVADDKDLVEFVEYNQQLRPSNVLVKHHFFEVMSTVKISTQPEHAMHNSTCTPFFTGYWFVSILQHHQ